MADQQPGGNTPAAGLPDGGKPVADPTRRESERSEASTVDAPARWSASAAVPPPIAKRAWWSRRRTPVALDGPALDPGTADATQWASPPAVDPWAGHDTPWDAMPAVPVALPPTRVESGALPPGLADAGALPPSPVDPWAFPATRVDRPARRGWGRKNRGRKNQPTAPANRLPVAPRPVTPRPVPPPPITPAPGTGPAPGTPVPPPSARRLPAPPEVRRPQALPEVRRPQALPEVRRPQALPEARRPQAPPEAQRPLPPPRRRRRWPRRLALFTLLSLACCCGVPAACAAWPPARQYPVTARLPSSVADLRLRDDGASRRAVQRLTQQLRARHANADQVFAGVYADRNGKRVTIFGTTGLRLTPGADVSAELRRLTDQYDIRDVRPFDLGETGVHERCGVGDAGGTSVVVCAWADLGSLATVVLTRRSVSDSAELTGILRGAVLTRT
jgi:hypothetical protein